MTSSVDDWTRKCFADAHLSFSRQQGNQIWRFDRRSRCWQQKKSPFGSCCAARGVCCAALRHVTMGAEDPERAQDHSCSSNAPQFHLNLAMSGSQQSD